MCVDTFEPLRVVRIEKLVFGGDGLAHLDGQALFVPAVAPGETVEVRIVERRSHYARAVAVNILDPSPARRTPPCPVFGRCGGCDWLHLAPEAQIAAKQNILNEVFAPLRLPPGALRPIVPADETLWYRNKLSFSVGVVEGQAVCGFHERRSPDRLVTARHCLLQSPASQRVVEIVERTLNERRLGRRPRPDRVTVREGRATGDRLIALRWARVPPDAERWAEHLGAEATTVVALGGGPLTASPLTGTGTFRERLGSFEFELGPNQFFQTHTRQAERMIEWIAAHVAAMGADRIVELYAGCGAITLFLSRAAREVTAVESDAESVATAARCAQRHGVLNVRWICGDAARIARELSRELVPDTVVADPPRAGLPADLRTLLAGGWGRSCVLVSCHPPALLRDLRTLLDAGWQLQELQPFDMFPQTGHIEVVALLVRRTE
ncbi:MAG: 23S rRNA (uracil(1939)-C(5))-methyltransferase RlmD [Kiritimatiellae bacterium]|nr:23S rRNA (uracil(1939)-C(5))-methyltransferase RlmD [Kiritimatiellia bacterium]